MGQITRRERRPLGPAEIESVSARLEAIADPRRLAIFEALREGELNVQELTDVLGIQRRNTSHHLAILLKAGLLTRRRVEGGRVLYAIEDWSAPWLIDRALESVAPPD